MTNLIDDVIAGRITYDQATEQFKRLIEEAALQRTGGSVTAAAALLGIHRNTLMARRRPKDAPRKEQRFEKWRGADATLARTDRRRR